MHGESDSLHHDQRHTMSGRKNRRCLAVRLRKNIPDVVPVDSIYESNRDDFQSIPSTFNDYVNLHEAVRCGLNTERVADG
jgi:hypothetical protein